MHSSLRTPVNLQNCASAAHQPAFLENLAFWSLWQVQWFSGDHCKFQWFWRDHWTFSMVFEKTITIECFLAVWPLPSMVFQWFLILLPLLSMVFDGYGPLVKRCDGFDGSLWSSVQSPFLSVLCTKCQFLSKNSRIKWGDICSIDSTPKHMKRHLQ